ncbi:unnamed protein product [Clavelina lepadiformis]|uniref:Peptidase S1 domain-containing protein n=1 Tax=Clavelina lepadiformis TaxID=159417 RepID=A0ABP0GSM9_CLALP
MRLCYMWNLGFILWFLFSETDAQQISCGTTPASTHGNAFARIFGGTRAVYGSIPWQVNLLENGSPRCGATLIHQKWILTAAHCVYLSLLNQNANLEYTAIAGDHDTEKDDLFEQLRFVVRVTVHQAFDGKTLENDIALLEVDKEFAFNNYVVPACLPNRGELPYPFTNCEVSGWGFTSATTKAEILQKLDLPVLPHKACEVIHTPTEGRPTIFTKKMLCAGHLEGGRDACQGDSGGPLVCPTYGSSNGEKFVNGIVSWGNGCAEQGQAGVYTNVASHRAWIDETLGNFVYMSAMTLPKFVNMDYHLFSF